MYPNRREAIQNYINWVLKKPEFQRDIKEVSNIYWSYYSETEDGARLAYEHWESEKC